MAKMPVISSKAFFSALIRCGCVLISVEGSHFKVRNPATNKQTIVPVHSGRDIDRAFAKAMLSQLGINADDFVEYI